jgi:hypothetical protein
MTDYNANDLVAMWRFQDNMEKHAGVLLKHGVELGALAMTIEIQKLLIVHGITDIDIDEIQDAKNRAMLVATKELEKRISRARGSDTTEK